MIVNLKENDPLVRRNTLVSEIVRVEDLGAAFDLSAFPLPMRVGPRTRDAGICFSCRGDALHVYMRIKPRNNKELYGVPRDEKGTLELNTCTCVNQAWLDEKGPAKAVEQVRGKIKDMVLHEVYEALLFRGERIMDPHDYRLRPEDQPF